MVSGLNKLCVAAIAVVGVLVLSPAAALADSCQGGGGATNIYSECIPTASGGTHHDRGGGHKTGGTTPAPAPAPAPVYPVTPAVTVTKKVQKQIAHVHHHKKLLKKLVTDPSLGATQSFAVPASYRATQPSTLGAFFDLGSGPMALFAMLATVAIVLLSVGGLRGRRQRDL